jgi:V/A-type H+-transporting ATPase subunit I
MIVRMKEITLFTSAARVDDAIRRLGQLGVVDVKEVQPPGDETLSWRIKAAKEAEQAIAILSDYNDPAADLNKADGYDVQDPKKLVNRILTSQVLLRKVEERLSALNKDLEWYKSWGEGVRRKDMQFLEERGLFLRLYLLDKSLIPSIRGDHHLVELREHNGKVPVVLMTRDPRERLPHKEVEVPGMTMTSVQQHIERKERQLLQISQFLHDHRSKCDDLKAYHAMLQDHVNMEQAAEGMGDVEGRVKYLRGYLPVKEVDTFMTTAEAAGWGYHIEDPEHPEDVPVYIKNPKWISIIDPVMKFIDIVPGYKEVDVSIYFLVAFALFFALLVGDAGYGLIFLLAALVFRKKMPTQMRVLVFVLSGATIIWGVLTGTYFGAEEIAALPYLNDLVIEEIASFGVNNISFMMHLTFLIGAIHLTIAHGVRVVQFINSIKALSEIGWIALVWGLFFVTEQLVLGRGMPAWGLWLFAAGGVLVALFSMESKNIFKSMGVSLANLPLSLISGFSDIVSYVRLFAVGMATAAVAASFNNMILPDGIAGMGFLNLLMAGVALLLGHGLNIALALMAVMVHGIRLNMLEFAGHLGVQFTGEAYKPFRLLSEEYNYDKVKANSNS